VIAIFYAKHEEEEDGRNLQLSSMNKAEFDAKTCAITQGACTRNLQLSFFFLSFFHAEQAAIKLPSAEASKRAQCTSPGQYAPYIKGIMKTP